MLTAELDQFLNQASKELESMYNSEFVFSRMSEVLAELNESTADDLMKLRYQAWSLYQSVCKGNVHCTSYS